MRWKVPSALTKHHGPQWLTAMTFAVAILAGTALLALPMSHSSGRGGDFVTALFLSTSAACVTGLSPVDIGTYLSLFGQLVVLALIQVGGLGIMTLGTFLFEVMGRKLSMSDEQVLMSSFGVGATGRVRSLLWRTIGFTVFWEGIGAIVLGLRFYYAHGFSAPKAAYHGVFHSVAAFCNAGFALYPDNLVRFGDDPVVLLTIAVLIIAGGIGFIVLQNLTTLMPWRRNRLLRGRLSLHTRIVLVGTLVLLVVGTLGVYAFEWQGALAGLSLRDRWVGAFFHSVTCRTAGFNSFDMESMQGGTKALSMLLMFIGGAPGSTAGGIKVSTAVILAATVLAMIRNRDETEFGHRTVPVRAVREALVISVLGLVVVTCVCFALHATESTRNALVPVSGLSVKLLFETISAFGTVGLSLNTTPSLSAGGQLAIVLCMYLGRVGPLTMALTMGGAARGPSRRYPEEDVVVG